MQNTKHIVIFLTAFTLFVIIAFFSISFAKSKPTFQCNPDALKPVSYKMKNKAVSALQQCLKEIGFSKVKKTGKFDNRTKRAVAKFNFKYFGIKTNGKKFDERGIEKIKEKFSYKKPQRTDQETTDNIITASRVVTGSSCDTDGGVNIYEAGIVTTTKQGQTTMLTDTCIDEKLLYEQYCISSEIGGGTVSINCLGSCASGACARTFDAAKCKSFGPRGTRAAEDTINLVIVGAGYSSVEEFIPWVQDNFASTFFSVEPWQSNQDAFNFYYVDEVAPFEQEAFSISNTWPLAEHCQKPNKVITFLVNSSFRETGSMPSAEQTLARRVGSAMLSAPYTPAYTDSKGNFYSAHLTLSPAVLNHELGHSIGALQDEYFREGIVVGETPASSLAPNCFSSGIPTTTEQCLAEAPWKDLISIFPESVGCFEGCYRTDKNIYRPTAAGLMRALDNPTFGLAEERSICCQILGKTGSVGGYCNLFNQEPLNLVEHCHAYSPY